MDWIVWGHIPYDIVQWDIVQGDVVLEPTEGFAFKAVQVICAEKRYVC